MFEVGLWLTLVVYKLTQRLNPYLTIRDITDFRNAYNRRMWKFASDNTNRVVYFSGESSNLRGARNLNETQAQRLVLFHSRVSRTFFILFSDMERTKTEPDGKRTVSAVAGVAKG